MSRILIAEDESRLASVLAKGLRAAGHQTTICDDGIQVAALACDADFDLLVLDIGLPGQDGFAVLRQMRDRGERMPVVVVTARDGLDDMIAGFDGGADDYVIKPFVLDELMARIRARLRGCERVSSLRPELRGGGLRLDLRARRVKVGDRTVELTAKEFELLEAFLEHPGQVLSRAQLLSRVWGYDYDPGSNVVDVYVGYLRRKLGGECFESIRGRGYRLRA